MSCADRSWGLGIPEPDIFLGRGRERGSPSHWLWSLENFHPGAGLPGLTSPVFLDSPREKWPLQAHTSLHQPLIL